jgi:exonuclease SbcD
MKILHTADWHLGKSIGNIPRHPEQIEVLNEICEIANTENVEAVIIAGDLFDTFNPPVESVELFYKTVKRLANNGKRLVVAIAGNHDSPDRIEAPDTLAKECGIILTGYPNSLVTPFGLDDGVAIINSDQGFIEARIPGVEYHLRIIITSYANEKRLKTYLGDVDSDEALRMVLEKKWKDLSEKYLDDKGVNVLMAHLYVMKKGSIDFAEPEDEKPILDIGGAQAVYVENIPPDVQYTALGHLHRTIKMKNGTSPVNYSGSPLSYSLSEADQKKCVMIIDAKPAKPVIVREIPLTKGRPVTRQTFSEVDSAVEWLKANPNSLVELTMQSNTYLKAEERKLLYQSHDGIIDIIPVMNTLEGVDEEQLHTADLGKTVEEIFVDYFHHEKGQQPNDEMISLFREVLGTEEGQ